MSLDELRKEIDQLDSAIIKSIAERMRVSGVIGEKKKELGIPVEDKGREKVVLEKVKSLARAEKLNPVELEKIYLRIISISKEAQGVTVSFQGEVGAYSEEASFQYFGPDARLKPCENLEDVFQATESDVTQYGMVPIENSLEGTIARTYDLLLDSKLKICGETELRVVHCLIGLPEAEIGFIKEVYSHPQALGQCKTLIGKMGWKATPSYDTAGSVKMIKEQKLMDKAAIASARAAEVYGMKILLKGIEDNQNNFTRFLVLGKQDAIPSENDKTSIVFTVRHKPGALYDALKVMADKGINLTKIESRPTRQKPWEYNFYVDFDGHCESAAVKAALRALDDHAVFVKILGSYHKAR
jgi:chorismate mutase/prephenate dehydratase